MGYCATTGSDEISFAQQSGNKPQKAQNGTHKRHKRLSFLCFLWSLLCNKAATFGFWTKFSGQHIPLLAEEGCPRHQKQWIRSDLSRTGWSVRRPFERPAELTTITASRYRARASRPSAPPLWLRGIFLMAQPLLRLRAIALALRALLCEAFCVPHFLLDTGEMIL